MSAEALGSGAGEGRFFVDTSHGGTPKIDGERRRRLAANPGSHESARIHEAHRGEESANLRTGKSHPVCILNRTHTKSYITVAASLGDGAERRGSFVGMNDWPPSGAAGWRSPASGAELPCERRTILNRLAIPCASAWKANCLRIKGGPRNLVEAGDWTRRNSPVVFIPVVAIRYPDPAIGIGSDEILCPD